MPPFRQLLRVRMHHARRVRACVRAFVTCLVRAVCCAVLLCAVLSVCCSRVLLVLSANRAVHAERVTMWVVRRASARHSYICDISWNKPAPSISASAASAAPTNKSYWDQRTNLRALACTAVMTVYCSVVPCKHWRCDCDC